jgi:hypothetical protein
VQPIRNQPCTITDNSAVRLAQDQHSGGRDPTLPAAAPTPSLTLFAAPASLPRAPSVTSRPRWLALSALMEACGGASRGSARD